MSPQPCARPDCKHDKASHYRDFITATHEKTGQQIRIDRWSSCLCRGCDCTQFEETKG